MIWQAWLAVIWSLGTIVYILYRVLASADKRAYDRGVKDAPSKQEVKNEA